MTTEVGTSDREVDARSVPLRELRALWRLPLGRQGPAVLQSASSGGILHTMPDLIVRLKKKADGSAALTCVRRDGSTTWQRQEGQQGRFFPIHDLTHYAVETVLGHRRGFYGLVAQGWDLTDFGAPWPKGPMPQDMDPAEVVVGFFDLQRASGTEWTAEDFNAQVASYYRQHGLPGEYRLTEQQLRAIRSRLAGLVSQWTTLRPGEALELPFPEGDPAD
jgi:hypothetical protein